MKIPHSVVGRTRPTQERDRYLQVSSSPDAFGASVGRAVSGLGSAVATLGDTLERREEQTKRFAALRALGEFNTNVTARVTEAKRNAEPDGSNFPAQVQSILHNMESKFLADRVPPNLQEEFRFRTGQILQGASADALRFQYEQQDAFSRAGLGDEFTQAQLGLARSPGELEHWETWMDEAVDATVLSEIEKETLKREFRKNLQGITYKEEAYRRANGEQSTTVRAPISYSKEELRGANDEVASVLSAVSADLGKKFDIRSGHRGPKQNKKAGGAKGSQHLHGKALDISTRGMSQAERGKVIRSAVANGANGIGVYATAVHIDTRSGSGVARWGPSYGHETFPEWAAPYVAAGLEDRKTAKTGPVAPGSGGGGAGGAGARTGGSRSWRNNNPGNLEFGDFAKRMGATGSDGRFAQFPDYETGRKAMEHLLFESSSYKNLSIEGAIGRYAPSSENDTGAYVRQVAGAVGVSADTKLSDLGPDQRSAMLDAMQKVEGWQPGDESAALDMDPRFNLLPYEDRLALQRDAEVRARKDQAAAKAAANEIYAEDLNSTLVRLHDGQAGQIDIDAFRGRHPNAKYGDIDRMQGVLEEKQEGVMLAQGGLAKLEAGGFWNAFDTDDKNMLNAMAKQSGAEEKLTGRDRDFVSRGLKPLVHQTQDIPTDVADVLAMMTRSTNDQTVLFAMDTLAQLEQIAPKAYAHRIPDRVQSDVELWRSRKGTFEQDELMKIIRSSNDPNERRHRQTLLEEGKTLAREIELEDVLGEFSGFLGFGTPEPSLDPLENRELRHEFREAFAEEYVKYGEEEGARQAALKRIRRDFGVSERGGRAVLMKYPPEKKYDPHPTEGGFDWIDEQVLETVGLEEGTRFELISDDQTRAEVDSGAPPTYTVMYLDVNGGAELALHEGKPMRVFFEQPKVSVEEEAADLAYKQALSRYKEMKHQLQLGETDAAVHGTPVPEEFRREFEEARVALEALGGLKEEEPVEPLPVGPRKRMLTEPWIPDNANR